VVGKGIGWGGGCGEKGVRIEWLVWLGRVWWVWLGRVWLVWLVDGDGVG